MTVRMRVLGVAMVVALGMPAARAAPPSNPPAGGSIAAANSAAPEAPPAEETCTIGTLRVQRYGDHGRPLILIPGLEGGSWVWRDAIRRFRGDHVIYAVSLAGFDGIPEPEKHDDLMGQAEASLLRLIRSRHIEKPVLIGHSIGGTLSIRFAELHSNLISGLIAVDGLPILPGFNRFAPDQRKAMAERMTAQVTKATPAQFQQQVLGYMQHVGTIDPAKAKLYAPLNGRSSQAAVAEYMKEDAESDFRPGLKSISVPLLEISPYNAPDFKNPNGTITAVQKAAYYKSMLAGVPRAKVISISPSRHFAMLDQPAKLDRAIADFLRQL